MSESDRPYTVAGSGTEKSNLQTNDIKQSIQK